MVNGLRPGRTSLHIWDRHGRTELLILVHGQEEDLEEVIRDLLENPAVRVRVIDRGRGRKVLLRGVVATASARADAHAIASAFLGSGGKLIDLLRVRDPN